MSASGSHLDPIEICATICSFEINGLCFMASPNTKGPIGAIDRPLILEVIDLAREGSLSGDIALYVVGAGVDNR